MYLVVAPDEPYTILAASQDLLDATYTDEAIFGRPCFEVFPVNPAAPEGHGTNALAAAFREVAATRASKTYTAQPTRRSSEASPRVSSRSTPVALRLREQRSAPHPRPRPGAWTAARSGRNTPAWRHRVRRDLPAHHARARDGLVHRLLRRPAALVRGDHLSGARGRVGLLPQRHRAEASSGRPRAPAGRVREAAPHLRDGAEQHARTSSTSSTSTTARSTPTTRCSRPGAWRRARQEAGWTWATSNGTPTCTTARSTR
jgi:hypothetical protein